MPENNNLNSIAGTKIQAAPVPEKNIGADTQNTLPLNIIQQALNYLANRVKPVDPIEERAKEQEEIINRIKNKFNDAKSFDELFSLFDNEVESIPKDLWDNSIKSELSISLEQNIERLENEQGRFEEKSERDTRETSEYNLRTVQEDSSNIFRGSFTQENEEINPDILFQPANTAGTKPLLLPLCDYYQNLIISCVF